MLVHAESPDSLTLKELDTYLAHGWFRMGQTIFTTQFLCFQNQLYNAVWLRVDLDEWANDSKQTAIYKRNAQFKIEIGKATYSAQHEKLFSDYKQGVEFEGSSSLHQLLFGESINNIYNTYEVNLFDGESLIACGLFDVGNESAEGISCFYNHAYKKYSLGKYLIYLKMEYCKNLGLHYFYPGYFVPGYKAFDYKVDIAKSALQYWNLKSSSWHRVQELELTQLPLETMKHKLERLQEALLTVGIESTLLRYEFFDANLVPHLRGAMLFDYPVFLYAFNLKEETIYPLLIFNVLENSYQWLEVRSVWVSNFPYASDEVYSSHVLKVDKIIFMFNFKEVVDYFIKSTTTIYP